MRRLLAPSLVLVTAVYGGILFAQHCPGCIERSRVNKSCDWTGDTAFAIDWNNPAHRQHLVADAQLAEDLAVRRADTEFNRLYGIEADGGQIDHGRFRKACMARLVRAIEANHAVTAEQIAVARGARSRLFDAAATVSFLPLFLLCAIRVSGRLHRRFSTEGRLVQLFALGAASIGTTFLALQAGKMWLGVWEAIRVRNGHMSAFRSATDADWSSHSVGALFAAVGGLVMFWLAAATWRQATLLNVTRSTALFSGTILAAMFAEVFVQHTLGYIPIVLALVVFYRLVLGGTRGADIGEPQGVLLH